jgi:hypothetical protein
VSRRLPLGGDPETYHLLAERMASGRGYVRPFGLAGVAGDVPTAEFPPLFPALLAALDLAGIDSPTGQKLAMAVVGAITAVVVGLVGRRVAGATAGLVAAGIVAVHPVFFENDAALAAESLYVLVVAGVILAAFRAMSVAGTVPWAVLGVLVGAAALVRAEALAFVPLLVVPAALRPGRDGAWLSRLSRMAAACGAAVVIVAPWTIRNALAVDAFVPVSSNAGTLLAGANCDAVYSGPDTGLWSLDCVFQIDAPASTEGERNAAYLDAGVDYVTDHLEEVPRVVAVRVLRTWGLFDPAGQTAWETFESRHRTWHRVGYGVHVAVVVLALAGALRLRLRLRRTVTLLPLLSMVVMVTVVSAASYGNQRFRVAADISLAVLAGAGAAHLGARAIRFFGHLRS